jgi:hypothetical protein
MSEMSRVLLFSASPVSDLPGRPRTAKQSSGQRSVPCTTTNWITRLACRGTENIKALKELTIYYSLAFCAHSSIYACFCLTIHTISHACNRCSLTHTGLEMNCLELPKSPKPTPEDGTKCPYTNAFCRSSSCFHVSLCALGPSCRKCYRHRRYGHLPSS